MGRASYSQSRYENRDNPCHPTGVGQSLISFNPDTNTATMTLIPISQDGAHHSRPTSSPAEKLQALLNTNKGLIVPIVYDGLTARLVKLAGFEVRRKIERLLVVGGSAGCATMGIFVWLCVIRCTRGKVPMSAAGLGPCHLQQDSHYINCYSLCWGLLVTFHW